MRSNSIWSFVTLFTLHRVIKLHPCCSMYSLLWLICHYMVIPHFVHPFTHWWTFGLFPPLSNLNIAAPLLYFWSPFDHININCFFRLLPFITFASLSINFHLVLILFQANQSKYEWYFLQHLTEFSSKFYLSASHSLISPLSTTSWNPLVFFCSI